MSKKQQVSILGYNKAIITDFIKKLLQKNYNISVHTDDVDGCVKLQDSLNRVSYFCIESESSIKKIYKSDIVINLLFIPTPSNFSKIKNNIKICNKIVNHFNKDSKIIDILPLINEDKIKSFYKDIKKHNNKSNKNFDHYITFKVSPILAKRDSLIQDIEALHKISGKFIKYKENFSYIDKDDLIDSIIKLLDSSDYKKSDFEIGSYHSTNIDYINDSVIIGSEDFKVESISQLSKKILSFIYKKNLSSFSSEYLYFLKTSKKPSMSSLNLNTLKIKNHSLMCILNKYKDK